MTRSNDKDHCSRAVAHLRPLCQPQQCHPPFVGPDSKLWLLGTDAQAPVQLTTNPDTQEGELAWTPDGTHLVYVSDEGKDNTGTANNDIWMMLADGTGCRQLTTNGSDDTTPVVDRQKRWIYFVSNRGYKVGIWRIPYPSDIN